MTKLLKTPLYNLHLELGAKMTEFAGYALPVQYTKGIIQEHLQCRSQAGFFDISHMGQCRILGDGAVAALENLTPGGLLDLTVGAQKYSLLTNADGGIIDDIIVTRIDSGLSLIVNAGCKAKDFAYLKQQLPHDCQFETCPDLALFALQGPAAAEVLKSHCPATVHLRFMQACSSEIAGIPCRISRSGYTGEDGFEISVHQTDAEPLARLLLASPYVEPIGLGARDTLRLEAGLCLYGHELSESITPMEARLQWLFKKDHTSFPGAKTILKQKTHGLQRRRVGLLIEGKIPLRADAELKDAESHSLGVVTSGSFSPSLGKPIAMALVEPSHAKIGTHLFATVRNSLITATVCPIPFVPHRYLR